MHGFEPSLGRDLASALGASETDHAAAHRNAPAPNDAPLRPGDAFGPSLVRGDFEVGATGTVTYVNGAHIYGFGHPFLSLGPTSIPWTRSHVFGVLPSLASSMKIADMGAIVGTMTQDRTSTVGGLIGAPPSELKVSVSLASSGLPEQHFNFSVLHDQALTPLFTYVALINVLAANERNSGPLTVGITGTVSFGADGAVAIDDLFTADAALTGPPGVIMAPLSALATNEWHPSLPDTLNVRLTTTEDQGAETIERAWLDTTKPHPGATHTLHVMLRKFRGDTEVVSIPVTMPVQPTGSLSLLVCDAPTLSALEQHELTPGSPKTLGQLVTELNRAPRNNRLYVRLLSSDTGTVVGGVTLPSLPASVREVVNGDKSVTTAPVSRSVVGSWEQRLSFVVRGSRELPLTLVARD